MNLNEYQRLASRTMNPALTKGETLQHALFELCSEIGEIHGIYQKSYQGHSIVRAELAKEIGDVLWGLAELCTALGLELGDIAEKNIAKLQKRYPNGFEARRSLNRCEQEES